MHLLERICFWAMMKAGVERWVGLCLTCIRYRQQPQRQEQVAVLPTHYECWEFVVADFEGPCNPADGWGNSYALAYEDELSTGTISEPLQVLQHSEV